MSHTHASKLKHRAIKHSVAAAKRFISILHHEKSIDTEQQAMLAAAHYTLALQHSISSYRSKMHLNSTITLLQNIARENTDESHIQHPNWISLLANAYTKRAELLEYEHEFSVAMKDYHKALELFDRLPDPLSNADRLQLAQCAISIADLEVNTQHHNNGFEGRRFVHSLNSFNSLVHPLFYVNKALENLLALNQDGEEIWTTLSYAHQIAGIALIPLDVIEAAEAFRTAVSMAFKATPKAACRLLGDIYNSIGLLYEQQAETCSIQQNSNALNDNALIYFALGLLFCPSEPLPTEESHRLLDYLFDTIYRVLDPFISPLSLTVMRDFIDALIFAYYSISDRSLPNEELYQHFIEPDLFSTFAQHIYWLVLEHHRRCDNHGRLLMLTNSDDDDLKLNAMDIVALLSNHNSKDNVHHLNI